MTDISAEPADFSGILAERAQADQDERQRNIRRGVAAAAVVLVHILALSIFIYSVHIPVIEKIKETIPQAITWIQLPQQARPPIPAQVTPPDIETIPIPDTAITIPPVRNPSLVKPQPGGLEGVGRSLACGAGSFENLSPLQKSQCLRKPWARIKRPDGTIVMLPPVKPVEPAPTIADMMRHEQQTAPPCPLLSNVPCLGRVIHGDPLGGNPRPF